VRKLRVRFPFCIYCLSIRCCYASDGVWVKKAEVLLLLRALLLLDLHVLTEPGETFENAC
jgi:hypothetical protein